MSATDRPAETAIAAQGALPGLLRDAGAWRKLLPGLSFALFLLIGATFTDVFFTERNIANLLRQVVANGLISLGMLLVILTGGIDLSVGPLVALGGVLFAGLADQHGLAPALVVAVVAGTLFGVFTLGVINNLMNLLGVRSFYQDIVKGAVIILAVLLVGRGRRP